jgi:hypothetical protein
LIPQRECEPWHVGEELLVGALVLVEGDENDLEITVPLLDLVVLLDECGQEVPAWWTPFG